MEHPGGKYWTTTILIEIGKAIMYPFEIGKAILYPFEIGNTILYPFERGKTTFFSISTELYHNYT